MPQPRPSALSPCVSSACQSVAVHVICKLFQRVSAPDPASPSQIRSSPLRSVAAQRFSIRRFSSAYLGDSMPRRIISALITSAANRIWAKQFPGCADQVSAPHFRCCSTRVSAKLRHSCSMPSFSIATQFQSVPCLRKSDLWIAHARPCRSPLRRSTSAPNYAVTLRHRCRLGCLLSRVRTFPEVST